MREALALARAAWLTAASYRANLVMTLLAAALPVLPLYYVTRALQPTMARAIGGEGAHYFAFVIVGLLLYTLATAAVSALPSAISGAIATGTLESLLATPARLPLVLAGLSAYGVSQAMLRAVALGVAGVVLGVTFQWGAAGAALVVVLLVVASYAALGMLDAAVVVAFRLRTPFATAVLTLSALLGGVWYPTRVIPSWLRDVAGYVPLAHASRAARRMLLEGSSIGAVRDDLLMLAALTTTLLAAGIMALHAAFRYARRHGTLGQY